MASTQRPCLHISFELILTDPIMVAELIRDFAWPERQGESFDHAAFRMAMSKQHKTYLAKADSAAHS